jgi:hypothetical protein
MASRADDASTSVLFREQEYLPAISAERFPDKPSFVLPGHGAGRAQDPIRFRRRNHRTFVAARKADGILTDGTRFLNERLVHYPRGDHVFCRAES